MSEGFALRADSKRLTMTARALNAYKAVRDDRLPAERRNEIKTWLGLRYDRPATPERFEALAPRLKATFIGGLPSRLVGLVRDVWVYYESETEVRLFFIIGDDAHRNDITDWVDDSIIQLADGDDVTVVERHVETVRGTTLWTLQNYYGLEATELSLPGGA